MKIVFMGSAALSCSSLERLLADPHNTIVAVVTRPDRPVGRHLTLTACPLRSFAEKKRLPVLAPENVNADESVRELRNIAPDLVVVVAYGQILRPMVLKIPRLGCVNLHASLLPAYRGAAPIQWAIARGERVTGVTTMFMNERMDAGDIIYQREVVIEPEDTAASLEERLAVVGAELLAMTVVAIREGRAPRYPQDETRASYAPRLRKEDGRIEWNLAAVEIHNRVRGFNPWPGCFTFLPDSVAGRRCLLRVWKTRVEVSDKKGMFSAERSFKPGEVVAAEGDGPLVATGRDFLRLLEVQPEGRRVMTGGAFLCGHRLIAGTCLG